MESATSRLKRLLKAYLAELDPTCLTIAQAAAELRNIAEIQRLAAGAMLLLGPRATEGEAWLKAGYTSEAAWLADVQQSSLGEAKSTLQTAKHLADLDATKDAVRKGRLSAAQAREIAGAAVENPGAERELLRSAQQDSFGELKDKARAAKTAALSQRDLAAREERIYRSRYLRSWTDHEGAFRLDARMTAEAGAGVISALERTAKTFFDQARKAEQHESTEAYLADALVELCKTKGDASKRSLPEVTLFVSAEALMRGSLDDGEICKIPGVGPVSLAQARSMIGDCFLKFVVTKGVDIAAVGHPGRTIPAHIWTALKARDQVCVVPGCGVAHSLEADHWQVPFHEGGTSSLDNLALLCTHHHRLKTHRGWQLVGGPGRWQLVPPEDPAQWFDAPPQPARRGQRRLVGAGQLFDTS